MARLTRPNGHELSGIRSIIDMLVADHGRESCPGAFAAPAGLTISKLRETSTTEKNFGPRQTKATQAFWLPPFADSFSTLFEGSRRALSFYTPPSPAYPQSAQRLPGSAGRLHRLVPR
jgi:hypothetical protein